MTTELPKLLSRDQRVFLSQQAIQRGLTESQLVARIVAGWVKRTGTEQSALYIHEAVKAAAIVCKVPAEDIIGPSRCKTVMRARHLAFYALCLQHSAHEVARLIDKDHTSIIHANRKIREQLKRDPKVRQDVARILTRLGIDAAGERIAS